MPLKIKQLILVLIFTGVVAYCAKATFIIIHDFLVFPADIKRIEMQHTTDMLIDYSTTIEGLILTTKNSPESFMVDKTFLKSKHNKPPLLDIQNITRAVKEKMIVKIGYHEHNYLRFTRIDKQSKFKPLWVYSLSTDSIEILSSDATNKEIDEGYFFSKILVPSLSLGILVLLIPTIILWVRYFKNLRNA